MDDIKRDKDLSAVVRNNNFKEITDTVDKLPNSKFIEFFKNYEKKIFDNYSFYEFSFNKKSKFKDVLIKTKKKLNHFFVIQLLKATAGDLENNGENEKRIEKIRKHLTRNDDVTLEYLKERSVVEPETIYIVNFTPDYELTDKIIGFDSKTHTRHKSEFDSKLTDITKLKFFDDKTFQYFKQLEQEEVKAVNA